MSQFGDGDEFGRVELEEGHEEPVEEWSLVDLVRLEPAPPGQYDPAGAIDLAVKGLADERTIAYVYGIVDKTTRAVQYVGASRTPRSRFSAHMKDYSMKDRGKLVLAILEVIQPCEHQAHLVSAREATWIYELLRQGHPLRNSRRYAPYRN